MWALSLADSRSYRVAGTGTTEYVRVADASLRLFGGIAILAFLVRVDVARGYLLIALPVGILVLVLERWLWRQWLVAHRMKGEYSARVLLVGSEQSVAQIARELERSPSAGYRVVGACVPAGLVAEHDRRHQHPDHGQRQRGVERAIAATGADTVAITSTDDLPPSKVKQISWALEAGHQHLVLAPSIVDIAGPRIHTRPVAGLPLIHVETPRFSRGQRVLKRDHGPGRLDLGVIIISPLLLALAIGVRMSGPGPVLFRQTRIGRDGAEFEMLKFRSMVEDAEDLLPSLLDQRDAGNEVLFKMSNDPRVTPIGRFMRRFSLDELPQLFNVIVGNMSLVGPRPPLRSEVSKYADHVHRRFLMKPGITGAWQVGGRSRLSWEDSVRLDLAYVENWSMIGDFVILAKTARAALGPANSLTDAASSHAQRPVEAPSTAESARSRRHRLGRRVTQPSSHSTGPTPMNRHHTQPIDGHADHDHGPLGVAVPDRDVAPPRHQCEQADVEEVDAERRRADGAQRLERRSR